MKHSFQEIWKNFNLILQQRNATIKNRRPRKETAFWNAFTALDNEEQGGVSPEDLITKLSASPNFDEEGARSEVEKKHSRENKLYMTKDGKYMRV